MDAKKARELTDNNQITIEKALENIEQRAKDGTATLFLWNLGHKVMTELMDLGFKVSVHTDPITDEKSHKIEW